MRIPAFQRGFVWEPDMVAFLMDSIYRGYPFGSLLFWRTKEPLKCEGRLGPFKLPESDPDYPVDYVLDGQQRITSIFGVFQTELKEENSALWTKIHFDYRADHTAQESAFFALDESQVDPTRHFPLRCLFDTTAYRRATKDFDDALATRIDEFQTVFKEARIPVQVIPTENRATVAIIFERVNRLGVPLDTLQLLSAWTWSEDFVLQESFDDLSEEIAPFGFRDVGADANLLLRCCAALLAQDASPDALVRLDGTKVRERFVDVANGVKGAIDFLRRNLNVYSLENLPFTTIIVPLSAFFAAPNGKQVVVTDEQNRKLTQWFWRCCFSRRYSSGVLRNLKTDIEEIVKLREGKTNTLGDFAVSVSADFFRENFFRVNTVNAKTFVLLLAQKKPLSFVSGAPVSLQEVLQAYNRNEFHHLFPKAYLEVSGQGKTLGDSCLANICFMSRSENVTLGGVAPSAYSVKVAKNVDQVLQRAICPPSLFDDDYESFVKARADLLSTEANALLK